MINYEIRVVKSNFIVLLVLHTQLSIVNNNKQEVVLPLGPGKPGRPLLPGVPGSPFSINSDRKGGEGKPGGPGYPLSPREEKPHRCWCD